MRRAFDARASLARLIGSLPAIVQITVATIVSFAFAHFVIGHPQPLIAAIMVISALGFVRDARPVRVLETVLGMTLGIALAEVLLLAVGQGIPQYAIALAVTLSVARFVAKNGAFAVAAAVQCSLVMLMPPPVGGPFSRTLDAVIGGAFALLATALIPRDPRRTANRSGRAVFAELDLVLGELATAMRTGEGEIAAGALARARTADALVAGWAEDVESGRAIARLSPFLRRSRFDLDRQATMHASIELCVRSIRVVARRAAYVERDGVPRPAIADLFSRIAVAMGLLADSLTDVSQQPVARQALTEIARHLDPASMLPDGSFADRNIVQAVRPFVVDALAATGIEQSTAQDLLPRV